MTGRNARSQTGETPVKHVKIYSGGEQVSTSKLVSEEILTFFYYVNLISDGIILFATEKW